VGKNDPLRPRTYVPLNRALSKLGIASRTQASELIMHGEISVDGDVCRDPDRPIDMETASISRFDKELTRASRMVVMLYKPRGVITSRKDEQGRPTVYSLLPENLQNLHCVGRLDWATSGLLLLTNDTALSAWLTDPGNAVERVYTVTVRGELTGEDADKMRKGMSDDNETLTANSLIVRKTSRRESHLVLTLTEGKNREIRRMCKALGHEVTRLKRVSFGSLTLGNLQPGQYRELEEEEVRAAFPGATGG
jgi:23S rRNA pseudouridine2605 synthase